MPQSEETETGSVEMGNIPDFIGRQKALFGNRVLPDSQPILDEVRAERI
jgi:hypothetical protein